MAANQVRATGRMALLALLAAVLAVLGGPVLTPAPVETAGATSASPAMGGAPVDALAPTRAVEPMLARPLGLSELGVLPAAVARVDLILAGDEPVASVAAAGAALLGMAGVRGPPRLAI